MGPLEEVMALHEAIGATVTEPYDVGPSHSRPAWKAAA